MEDRYSKWELTAAVQTVEYSDKSAGTYIESTIVWRILKWNYRDWKTSIHKLKQSSFNSTKDQYPGWEMTAPYALSKEDNGREQY